MCDNLTVNPIDYSSIKYLKRSLSVGLIHLGKKYYTDIIY